MTEDKPRFELSAVQVIGGALTAASAAVAASLLGVAGTVIGAAVASIVTTVGGAMYTHSVHRGRYAIERARTARLSQVRLHDAERTPDRTAEQAPAAEQTQAAEQTSAAESETQPEQGEQEDQPDQQDEQDQPTEQNDDADERRPGWRDRFRGINPKAVAVTAACVLALALGVITGVEALLGEPISSALNGGKDQTGTSIGSLAGGGHATSRTTRTPGSTATPTPSVTATVTKAPTTPTRAPLRPTSARPSTSNPTGTKPTSHAPTTAPTTSSGSSGSSDSSTHPGGDVRP